VNSARIVSKGSDTNFDAHLGIAKDRDAKTSPYRLMVRHPPSELAGHFGSRPQNGAVRLWHVIRVDVRDIFPVKTDGVQHRRHIVESLVDFCFNGAPSQELEPVFEADFQP